MENEYCVVSKLNIPTEGRSVLMSFAQTPIKKTYKYIHWQNDNLIGSHWDKATANRALNRYCSNDWELVEVSIIQKEFDNFKQQSNP